jgi:hypothetical protein
MKSEETYPLSVDKPNKLTHLQTPWPPMAINGRVRVSSPEMILIGHRLAISVAISRDLY